jgi:hypothetical protein
MRSMALLLMTIGCTAACGTSAYAQSYPVKPPRILFGYTAGGTGDIVARLLAQRMAESLGQNVVVENRPGAGGLQHKLPWMSAWGVRAIAEHGLISYRADLTQITRRAAASAVRIFKGATPADIPIEQPTHFNLIVNLKSPKHSASRYRRRSWCRLPG